MRRLNHIRSCLNALALISLVSISSCSKGYVQLPRMETKALSGTGFLVGRVVFAMVERGQTDTTNAGPDIELESTALTALVTNPPLSEGERLDPWGNPYHVALDNHKDGRISINGIEVPSMNVIAWSNGRNGTNEFGGGDDIVSWESEDQHIRRLRTQPNYPSKTWHARKYVQ